MKQGINFELPIEVDVNLDDVESITFLFVQGDVRKTFEYPSSNAYRVDNDIKLKWTESDSWLFRTKQEISMDTKIRMTGTINNPETEIVTFKLAPTLFEKEE